MEPNITDTFITDKSTGESVVAELWDRVTMKNIDDAMNHWEPRHAEINENTKFKCSGGTPTTPAPMQQANALVNEFMQQNAVQYIAALPNLSNRLIRKGETIGQSFAVNGTNERLYLQGNLAAQGTEFWIDGTYIDTEDTHLETYGITGGVNIRF